MQPIRPAPPVHLAPGKLVDDDDLAVIGDIIDVLAEHDIGLQRLIEVMHDQRVLDIVQIAAHQQPGIFQQPLDVLEAILGHRDVLGLFIGLVVLGHEALHDGVHRYIEVALVVGGARDNQRGARFINKDRIHLVDDGIVEGALRHLAALMLHVVAQIIEAELVVGGIGDVGVIGDLARLLVEIGHDHPHGEAEEAVDLPHPARVAVGEIVVHGHDVDALALQRVQVTGQRGHQRLALAGAHFSDFAAMEHDAANHLHIEMAHAQHALGCLAHRGEGLGQDIVERFAGSKKPAQLVGLAREVRIGQPLQRRLESGDRLHDLVERLDVTVVG